MENLNDIIDINEEEVKDGIKTYQKYHSEEAVDKLYQVDPVSEHNAAIVTMNVQELSRFSQWMCF